jgi:hypothetical protein
MSTLAETEAKMSLTFEEIKAIFEEDQKTNEPDRSTVFFINIDKTYKNQGLVKMEQIMCRIDSIAPVNPSLTSISFSDIDNKNKVAVGAFSGYFYLEDNNNKILVVNISKEVPSGLHGGKKSKRSRKSKKSKKSRKSGKSRKSYK